MVRRLKPRRKAPATAGCARRQVGLAGEAENLADAGSDGRDADRAEEEAIRVFARNLKDLLLAAPAGGKATMGWTRHPHGREGGRGDATGKVLATDTVLSVPAEERIARGPSDVGPAYRARMG